MIWTAAIAFMLDRRFLPAAAWLLAAAGLSCLGLIHAFRITDRGIQTVIGFLAAPAFAMSYLAGAAFLVAFHYLRRAPGYNRGSRRRFLSACETTRRGYPSTKSLELSDFATGICNEKQG